MTELDNNHVDAKTYRMQMKSIQDKNNSKNQKIAGELYVKGGFEKVKYALPIVVAGAIIGIAGHMTNKLGRADDLKAAINYEINDDENSVLEQVRLAEIFEEQGYTTDQLYETYKEAQQAIKEKEADSNIVNINGTDIEIDKDMVQILLSQNKDNALSYNQSQAEALTVAAEYVVIGLEDTLKQENNVVR